MAEHPNAHKEILNVHNSFWNALAERNIELRFSLCADDVTFIGTGLHERANNKAEYQAINAKGLEQYARQFEIHFLWTQLTVFESVAWVECEVEWIQELDSGKHKELIRNTTILKYERGKWLVTHVHGSTPDYRYVEGGYMSDEKTMRRNKELEHEVFNRTEELQNSMKKLKETQSQLIQAEKMASLGELTAGIAHEIQNPLNFVNNFSEINAELIEELRSEKSKPKSERDDQVEESLLNDITTNLEKINLHGKRADAIVKGMLQHSRSSSGTKEATDINQLADEYLRLAYHGLRAKDKLFNATLQTDFDKSIEQVHIVPQDIGRVILNLITNAFYAVSEKKKEQPVGYEPTVGITTKKAGGKIHITVKDNGNGIPQKVLDKIFQPFFTTKPTGQGTGLGLSLSYDIVKAHDGELRVTTSEMGSQPAEVSKNAGTAFCIILPA